MRGLFSVDLPVISVPHGICYRLPAKPFSGIFIGGIDSVHSHGGKQERPVSGILAVNGQDHGRSLHIEKTALGQKPVQLVPWNVLAVPKLRHQGFRRTALAVQLPQHPLVNGAKLIEHILIMVHNKPPNALRRVSGTSRTGVFYHFNRQAVIFQRRIHQERPLINRRSQRRLSDNSLPAAISLVLISNKNLSCLVEDKLRQKRQTPTVGCRPPGTRTHYDGIQTDEGERILLGKL